MRSRLTSTLEVLLDQRAQSLEDHDALECWTLSTCSVCLVTPDSLDMQHMLGHTWRHRMVLVATLRASASPCVNLLAIFAFIVNSRGVQHCFIMCVHLRVLLDPCFLYITMLKYGCTTKCFTSCLRPVIDHTGHNSSNVIAASSAVCSILDDTEVLVAWLISSSIRSIILIIDAFMSMGIALQYASSMESGYHQVGHELVHAVSLGQYTLNITSSSCLEPARPLSTGYCAHPIHSPSPHQFLMRTRSQSSATAHLDCECTLGLLLGLSILSSSEFLCVASTLGSIRSISAPEWHLDNPAAVSLRRAVVD